MSIYEPLVTEKIWATFHKVYGENQPHSAGVTAGLEAVAPMIVAQAATLAPASPWIKPGPPAVTDEHRRTSALHLACLLCQPITNGHSGWDRIDPGDVLQISDTFRRYLEWGTLS